MQPLYQSTNENTDHQTAYVTFHVAGSKNRDVSILSYKLKKELVKRAHLLNQITQKPITVKISATISHGGIGYNMDAKANRILSRLTAQIHINGSKDPIKLDSVTSYNILAGQDFVTQNAYQSAQNRLIIDSANRIQLTVANYIKKNQ